MVYFTISFRSLLEEKTSMFEGRYLLGLKWRLNLKKDGCYESISRYLYLGDKNRPKLYFSPRSAVVSIGAGPN